MKETRLIEEMQQSHMKKERQPEPVECHGDDTCFSSPSRGEVLFHYCEIRPQVERDLLARRIKLYRRAGYKVSIVNSKRGTDIDFLWMETYQVGDRLVCRVTHHSL